MTQPVAHCGRRIGRLALLLPVLAAVMWGATLTRAESWPNREKMQSPAVRVARVRVRPSAASDRRAVDLASSDSGNCSVFHNLASVLDVPAEHWRGDGNGTRYIAGNHKTGKCANFSARKRMSAAGSWTYNQRLASRTYWVPWHAHRPTPGLHTHCLTARGVHAPCGVVVSCTPSWLPLLSPRRRRRRRRRYIVVVVRTSRYLLGRVCMRSAQERWRVSLWLGQPQ